MEYKKIYKVISIFVAIILWQILSMVINSKILIASPAQVLVRCTTIVRERLFWQSIVFSLIRICVGYLLGVTLAMVLGFLADRFKVVEYFLWPYMISIRSIPVASIVVICLIWLSASNISGFVSALIVIPVVYNSVYTALQNKNRELEEVSRVYAVNGLKKLRTVLLPEVAPYLLSACSVTAGMAWKAGVAAEVIGTPMGSIGRQLYLAKTYLDTVDLFTWTLTIVIVSVLFEKIFIWILKTLLSKTCGYDGE